MVAAPVGIGSVRLTLGREVPRLTVLPPFLRWGWLGCSKLKPLGMFGLVFYAWPKVVFLYYFVAD